MNELKHEDVIKALEICADETQTCYDCPYTDHCTDAHKDALALLREKDEEIERLTAYNANLICANTDITNRHKDYVEDAERIARADAITEFAERLKTFYKHLPGNTVGGAVEYHIDQIAKEMKEGRG